MTERTVSISFLFHINNQSNNNFFTTKSVKEGSTLCIL